MRYAVYNHQGKAEAYIEALEGARCNARRNVQCTYQGVEVMFGQHILPKVDFVLTDNDVRGRARHLEKFRKAGTRRFFVYPHTARPNVVNDIHGAWEHTTAHFVISEGHKAVMEAYGYEKPVHVVGWSMCPLREFRPRARVWKVLFAPIHPRCGADDRRVNQGAFERLRVLAEEGEIELTVRYINELGKCGLERVEHENIIYTQGELELGWEQIDEADVVVAHQTFLYLAVARGVPAVGMGTGMAGHLMPGGRTLYAPRWKEYVEMMAFPLDIEDGDTLEVLVKAALGEAVVAEWRERMIGEAFDEVRFLGIIDSYVREL